MTAEVNASADNVLARDAEGGEGMEACGELGRGLAPRAACGESRWVGVEEEEARARPGGVGAPRGGREVGMDVEGAAVEPRRARPRIPGAGVSASGTDGTMVRAAEARRRPRVAEAHFGALSSRDAWLPLPESLSLSLPLLLSASLSVSSSSSPLSSPSSPSSSSSPASSPSPPSLLLLLLLLLVPTLPPPQLIPDSFLELVDGAGVDKAGAVGADRAEGVRAEEGAGEKEHDGDPARATWDGAGEGEA